ncbi:MAG TPA: glycoside hydrolase family 3 N-terminal domain-containing protein [Microbacterium sp.]|nr:glycoside hydrolase family 3 N-terminal domain-containing protein [Microbacterium sp.]
MTAVELDAHAVLFPICNSTEVVDWLEQFLRAGGRSFLMASSTEEYAARRVSEERSDSETAVKIASFVEAAQAVATGPLLVSADAEPTGVERLEHLLPPIPDREALRGLTAEGLSQVFTEYGQAARELGVALFLGPVVDNVWGRNEWLAGRTLADSNEEITRIASAYVRSVQATGVSTMAKHFPGHPDLAKNPVYDDVNLTVSAADVEQGIAPFRALIEAGVDSVMVGPVTVETIDPVNPAATSPTLIGLLREDLGFDRLVVSDDLDAASTMKGRSLGQVAVDSIAAGVDLLLIPGGAENVEECANALFVAVDSGELSGSKLAAAADRVRALAASK